MSQNRTSHADAHPALGRCPFCGAHIPEANVLIQYERSDGPAVFAECPDCWDVVRPE